MKLAIIYVGAVRESLKSIRRNILELTKCYEQYKPEIIFSTWQSAKKPFVIWGMNYACEYDIELVREQTKGIIDKEVLLEQNLEDYYRNKGHNGPVTPYYMLKGIADYLKAETNLYDYVVISRHDNLFRIKNVEAYFNDQIYVPPMYWNGGHKYSEQHISDHFWIMPYHRFLSITTIPDSTIANICQQSIDNEQFMAHFLNEIGKKAYIKDEDILTFINRDMPERHWKVSS